MGAFVMVVTIMVPIAVMGRYRPDDPFLLLGLLATTASAALLWMQRRIGDVATAHVLVFLTFVFSAISPLVLHATPYEAVGRSSFTVVPLMAAFLLRARFVAAYSVALMLAIGVLAWQGYLDWSTAVSRISNVVIVAIFVMVLAWRVGRDEQALEMQRNRLLESSDQFATVIERSKDAILTMDTELRIAAFNGPAQAIVLGLSGKKLRKGRPVLEVVPDPMQAGVQHQVATAVQGEEDVKTYHLNVQDRARAIQTTVSPFASRTGDVIGFCIRMHDVTDLAALAHEYDQQLHGARVKILNTAAHHLSTPLTPALLQVHLLQDQALGPLNPRQLEALSVTRRNLERLTSVAQSIQLSATAEGPGIPLDRRPVRPGALLVDAIAECSQQAQDAGLHVEVDAEGQLAVLDERHMHEALVVLISNAIKYSPSGGTVSCSSANDGTTTVFVVRDQGPGMTPAEVKEASEPIRMSSLDDQQGLGLGLHRACAIVHAHGGTLSFETPGPGQGTRIEVRIPGPRAARQPGDRPNPNARKRQRPADGSSPPDLGEAGSDQDAAAPS